MSESASNKKTELEIGNDVVGQGVFIGTWQPKDGTGNSLGKTFNVFAAPQDLTDISSKGFARILRKIFNISKVTLTYDDAAEKLENLENWHGFNGANYKNDADLYKALKDGAYKGEWFIPTIDLLMGIDKDEKKVQRSNLIQNDNLYAHKSKGALKDTFTTSVTLLGWLYPKSCYSSFPTWYWSCTNADKWGHSAYAGRFSDNDGGQKAQVYKSQQKFNCRPVRVVEA